MPQSTVRFSDQTLQEIHEAVRQKGFTSVAALIRHAVQQELTGHEEGAEQRMAATLDQIRGELSRLHRVQQTLFAFVDCLAKSILTGLPEQSPSSVARGKERYEHLVKSASAAMLNGAPSFLRDEAEL
jgi:Arc/MetJ-type ribon-helix-helix transcriptional regulator